MTPIHELISRIRWDADYGAADFSIGYYDRVTKEIERVAFSRLMFDPDDHFAFQLIDSEGVLHTIPYHRIRELYRNGQLIWHRDG